MFVSFWWVIKLDILPFAFAELEKKGLEEG